MKLLKFTAPDGSKYSNKPTRVDKEKTYGSSDVPKVTDSIIYSFLMKLKNQGVTLGFDLPRLTLSQAKGLTPEQVKEFLVVPTLNDEIKSKIELVEITAPS
jgi:hypothetical protein